jgi:hypothetical protein
MARRRRSHLVTPSDEMPSVGTRIDTPWLGRRRGRLGDWLTQRWVQASGRLVSLAEHPWLDPTSGDTTEIGADFFERVAEREGLVIVRGGGPRGLVPDVALLEGPGFSVRDLARPVVGFYERTSEYELDIWSEWSGPFLPFGRMLAMLFSRRLQQLNVPLSPLDTRLGVTSKVLQLRTPGGELVRTVWVREIAATGYTLFAGSYSVCTVPGHPGPCIRVVFPSPTATRTSPSDRGHTRTARSRSARRANDSATRDSTSTSAPARDAAGRATYAPSRRMSMSSRGRDTAHVRTTRSSSGARAFCVSTTPCEPGGETMR